MPAATCIVVVLACGAAAARPVGQDVNVSRLPGAQNEATVTIDPRRSAVLLAGSNSFFEGTMRYYESADGGGTWATGTVTAGRRSPEEQCAADPVVAVDASGRQYFTFLRWRPCGPNDPPRVVVSSRPGHGGPWSPPVPVASLEGARAEDKPAMAVDVSPTSPYRGRVYVAWSRITKSGLFSIRLSHSDDGGLTWSRAVKVNRSGTEVTYATIALSRRGTVYAGWDDVSQTRIHVSRSTDGGRSFGPERVVAAFTIVPIPHCGSGLVLRALRTTCVHANPVLSVDNSGGRHDGRVYVTYTQTEFTGIEGTRLSVLGDDLRSLAGYPLTRYGRPVTKARKGARPEQFWPQSAVDQATGALWVCYYDAAVHRSGTKAVFTCTASTDGGATFAKPVRVASALSDVTDGASGPRDYGDYEGVAAAGGVAHPIWTDARGLPRVAEEIYTARLTLADLG